MKNALICTQHHENYGAHDWNGEGVCPQRWKAKGGTDHIFTNVPDDMTEEQVLAIVASKVSYRNDYFESYVIGFSWVEDGFKTDYEQSQLRWHGAIDHPEPREDITTLIK